MISLNMAVKRKANTVLRNAGSGLSGQLEEAYNLINSVLDGLLAEYEGMSNIEIKNCRESLMSNQDDLYSALRTLQDIENSISSTGAPANSANTFANSALDTVEELLSMPAFSEYVITPDTVASVEEWLRAMDGLPTEEFQSARDLWSALLASNLGLAGLHDHLRAITL